MPPKGRPRRPTTNDVASASSSQPPAVINHVTDAINDAINPKNHISQPDVILSPENPPNSIGGSEMVGNKEDGVKASGGKAKKIVKKTVKVVKKVIKKVPKKVVRGGIDCKVDVSSFSSEELKPGSVELGAGKANEEKVRWSDVVEGEENNLGDNELEEVRRGEEKVGERRLFSGELGAMERKKRRKTEVFVGGLGTDVTEEDVREVFSEVGEIVDLTLVINAKTGKNKIAFLRYGTAEEAKKALDKFSQVEICGKKCRVTPVDGNDTIFLGNINKKWKEEDLTKLLHDIGIDKLDKVTVMIDPNSSERNRGFAFVELETSKDAQIAYRKLQKKDAFGKNQEIKVAWAEPLKELDEEEMLKVKTVYAEFIPSSWDEQKVRDVFKKFGEIDDIVLARSLRTTKRKDFAFICYKAREAAIKCIETFSHGERDEHGSMVNVKVSLAKPMTKSKKLKPAAKSVAKEVPKAKPKASYSNVRPIELGNRVQPGVARYHTQFPERSSTNVELVQLLREQASWRPPHAILSNSPMDMHYSNPLSGRKRQYSAVEDDPRYQEMPLYPRSRLDTSFPGASSSHSHSVVPPTGLTSSLAYHQRHSGYTSGSVYGARNYASDIEMRDKAHASSNLYRRCFVPSIID